MNQFEIRQIEKVDYGKVVQINESVVDSMSPMDEDRLHELLGYSEYAKAIISNGNIAGFILAMNERSEYNNENHKWYYERYSSFLYIDRIAISPEYNGKGLGTYLYNDVINYAKNKNIENIVCEINVVPLNEQSISFHRKFGFIEVGQQTVKSGKIVSMQLRSAKENNK